MKRYDPEQQTNKRFDSFNSFLYYRCNVVHRLTPRCVIGLYWLRSVIDDDGRQYWASPSYNGVGAELLCIIALF